MPKVKQRMLKEKQQKGTLQSLDAKVHTKGRVPQVPKVVGLQRRVGNQAVQRMLSRTPVQYPLEWAGRMERDRGMRSEATASVASTLQRQPTPPAQTPTASAGPAEDVRLNALKALWTTTVVGGLRGAHQALIGLWPKARPAMQKLLPVLSTLRTLVGAYGSKPLAHARLLGLYHVVGWFYRALAPHAGEMVSLSGIRDRLDPAGKVVSSHLERTKSVL